MRGTRFTAQTNNERDGAKTSKNELQWRADLRDAMKAARCKIEINGGRSYSVNSL